MADDEGVWLQLHCPSSYTTNTVAGRVEESLISLHKKWVCDEVRGKVGDCSHHGKSFEFCGTIPPLSGLEFLRIECHWQLHPVPGDTQDRAQANLRGIGLENKGVTLERKGERGDNTQSSS